MAIKSFYQVCSILNVDGENNLDYSFYGIFIPLFVELKSVVPLYNKARNFLSQKPSDEGKYLLKFDNSTFANGWDNPQQYSVRLFRRHDKYLLGVVNSKPRSILNNLDKVHPSSEDDRIDFLDYKQGGQMNNNLLSLIPKDGKTKKAKGHREGNENPDFERELNDNLPSDIYRIRKLYKEKTPISREDLTRFINYYQHLAKLHYKHLSFTFKDACEYESFDEFTDDAEKQAYRIAFVPTSYEHLKSLVVEGKLYLFDIKNKDYKSGTHRNKNLHTLYWKQIFSKENLDNLVIKLNAKSMLFCRPQVIKNPKSHKKGTILLNRRDRDGNPIPEHVYQRLYKLVNNNVKRKIFEDKLNDEEKRYINKITTKVARYKIIKDERYTEQKYFIHIPITLNANAPETVKAEDFNREVKDYITANPDINIIGIDRGERNLLYLSLINQKGEILEQKSLNVINGFDYHEKLTQREEERDKARKSWQAIGNITDLKEGYLSAAIHEITKMMIENNAIIVLEDLNKGFHIGRFKFEKQVYRLFEKKLIEKLNYLCSKDNKPTADGGILRGYQLTNKFVSFKEMTKQNGFLFYVRPDYTSSIDPVTGFVAHFNFSEIRDTAARKKFFEEMESITFNRGNVEFVFDYHEFNPKTKDRNVWTVSTFGKRIIWDKKGKKRIEYKPTEEIINAFKAKDKTLEEGTDIKALLSDIDSSPANKKFYNNLFWAFRRTVQMRNSNSETHDDYILSPAIVNGKQFNSMDEKKREDVDGNIAHKLPIDADANGAYHIALKGLYLLRHPQEEDIKNEEWFKFVVEKPFKQK